MRKFHCFFEQSGTFKNEFKKLGFKAYDYDIQNEFEQTDFVVDLFDEILRGYEGKKSIFDNFNKNEDYLIAFFPCVRFEDQIQMHFRGTAFQLKNKTVIEKLENDLILHKDLSYMYELITKLTIICCKKQLPLVIENPHSTTHYLVKYWAIPYSILDNNRHENGDYYSKPTQYWFINCKPQNNFIFEPLELVKKNNVCKGTKKIEDKSIKTTRSMIHPQYANRFIREYIIDESELLKKEGE